MSNAWPWNIAVTGLLGSSILVVMSCRSNKWYMKKPPITVLVARGQHLRTQQRPRATTAAAAGGRGGGAGALLGSQMLASGAKNSDRRLLHVPLVGSAAHHHQDGRPQEPGYRDVPRPGVRHSRRNLYVRHGHVFPHEPAHPDQHRLRQDERCRQGEGRLSARRP